MLTERVWLIYVKDYQDNPPTCNLSWTPPCLQEALSKAGEEATFEAHLAIRKELGIGGVCLAKLTSSISKVKSNEQFYSTMKQEVI